MHTMPVLLVEDHVEDQFLTLRVLRKNHISNVVVISEGAAAIDYLKKAHYDLSVRPKLVILDLRMPKLDGFDIIQEIRSDESLMDIPIVILTSSASPREIEKCHELGVSAFLSKPLVWDDLEKVLHRFTH